MHCSPNGLLQTKKVLLTSYAKKRVSTNNVFAQESKNSRNVKENRDNKDWKTFLAFLLHQSVRFGIRANIIIYLYFQRAYVGIDFFFCNRHIIQEPDTKGKDTGAKKAKAGNGKKK